MLNDETRKDIQIKLYEAVAVHTFTYVFEI
jgi:hypothetical protein